MKLFVIVATVLFLGGIQLCSPDESSSAPSGENDFLVLEKAPESIRRLFRRSCYNCHSNQSSYKRGDNIASSSKSANDIIKKGQFSLNFSKWGVMESWQRRLFLCAVPHDIYTDRMPQTKSKIAHLSAPLSEKEKDAIQQWINTLDFFKE